MPVTDASIVRRVAAGDIEAFALLVDRHYARCLRLALHILGSGDDAEDAAQETFLRAFRSLATYEERERFAAWLSRILVNQCRTTLARRRRIESWPSDWLEAASPPGDAAVDDPERREDLRRALDRLPAEQREALVLRFADDLTYEEMAAATGAGVSALKMRVRRACSRLRALLEPTHVP